MTRIQPRLLAVAALFAAAPALVACGAGHDANLTESYSPTEAAQVSANGITIAQAFILGPASGAQITPGSAAPIYLTMLNSNTAPDQLVSITTDSQMATSTRAAGAISLPPGQLVYTGTPTPRITLEGTKKSLYGGESTKLTLNFQNAGAITVDVPVITRNREFADLPTAPSSTPESNTATPSPSTDTTP